MKVDFDYGNCNEEQLWRFVGAHLASRGVGVVLVGGAVVAIYSDGAYRSGDLDFVQEHLFGNDLEAAMLEIGFHKNGRHFEHSQCAHLFVEFVSGPLGIGEDTEIVPREVKESEYLLKILSPTDCVRDRLASFIHFRAREYLEQAVLVAKAQEVSWKVIERWCKAEGDRGAAAFEDLKRLCGK